MPDTQETQTSEESTAAQTGDGVPNTRDEAVSSGPDNIAPPVAAMIASIRAALAANASSDARIAGASACRSILTVLEAKPGQLLGGRAAPTQPQSPLASLLSQPGLLTRLAAMSREQLLDLLRQVTGAASQRTQSPAAAGPRFHLIQIPTRPGGG
jgi:hypothetical protein